MSDPDVRGKCPMALCQQLGAETIATRAGKHGESWAAQCLRCYCWGPRRRSALAAVTAMSQGKLDGWRVVDGYRWRSVANVSRYFRHETARALKGSA